MMFKKRNQENIQDVDSLNLAVNTMLDQKKAILDGPADEKKFPETRKQRNQRKKADKLLKKKAKKLKIPKTVQESIPYKRVYPNSGLIETRDGVFVRCYILGDINYTMLQREEQEVLIVKFGELVNSLDCASHFQFLEYQQMRNKADFQELVLLDLGNDNLTPVRKEHNDIYKEDLEKGRNEMHKPKYMCVEITAPDYSTAVNAFSRLDREISKSMQNIGGATVKALSAAEYLELLHNIYNPTQVGFFGNQVELNTDGELVYAREKFSFDIMKRMGLCTKDVIGPEAFSMDGSYGKTGNVFFRSLFVKDIPSQLKDYYMEKLTEVNCKMLISLQYEPIDMKIAERMVKNDLRSIQSNLIDRQKAASQQGYSADLLPSEMKTAYVDRESVHEALSSKSEKLFYQTIVITHFADTLEQLNEDSKSIQELGQSEFLTIRPLTGQEIYGWYASLPLCCNPLDIKRTLLTKGVAMFMPFSSVDVQDLNGGIYYGKSAISQKIILIDRRKGKNGNAFIVGDTGSGKSVMAKLEMENVIISSNDHVIVIDPDGEYHRLAKRLGGEIIRIAPDSKMHINPLDLNIVEGINNALGEKVDFVSSMFEVILGENTALTPTQYSVIDECVRRIYIPYLETRNPTTGKYNRKKMPTLKELYYELNDMDNIDGMFLASALSRFAVGTQDFFAHRTNVRYHSRFVVYDTKDLGENSKALGELVVLNAVWNEICRGRKQGRRVWFYVDEVHLLLRNPRSTLFLQNVYKRARKYGGLPCGITQNISDVLDNDVAKTMIANSDFMIIMGQAQGDIDELQTVFRTLNDALVQHIRGVPPGHGLIYSGNDFIPFVNEIPRDSNLYRAMTTTLSEVVKIEQQDAESEEDTNG